MHPGARVSRETWWNSSAWEKYELAYGAVPGARSRLLAEAPWSTQILDVTQDEAALWRGVRRSYHALIHAAQRVFAFDVLGAADVVGGCRGLHLAAAGRVTRSLDTWECMADWVHEGHALALGARPHPAGMLAGYVYFVVWNQWAYYASAAAAVRNLNHALMWEGILALKARGVETLELGWQGQAADRKGQDIEFFRRGFGGRTVLLHEFYGQEEAATKA